MMTSKTKTRLSYELLAEEGSFLQMTDILLVRGTGSPLNFECSLPSISCVYSKRAWSLKIQLKRTINYYFPTNN